MKRKKRIPKHELERQGKDPATRKLYFGCGGILGFVIGVAYCLGATEAGGWELLLYLLAFIVGFGLVSMLAGDRFWNNLGTMFRSYR